MLEIGKRQKRIKKLKKRNDNISKYRKGPILSGLIRLKGKTILGSGNLEKNYISIYANKKKRITQEEIKSIQTDILSSKGLTMGKLIKLYNCNFTIIPNKILTNKGILVRMGKGKGKVKTYVKYLTQGTICIELIQKNKGKISPIVISNLKKLKKKYTYLSYRFLI